MTLGDVLSIDWNEREQGLTFSKEAEGALVPMSAPVKEKMTGAAAASSDGRPVVFPAATVAMDANIENRTAPSAGRSIPVEKAKNEKK